MAKADVQKIVQELYDGQVIATHYPLAHRYIIVDQGEKVKGFSVTAVTGQLDKSQALIIWATRLDFAWLRQKLEARTGERFSVEELYPLIDEAEKQHSIAKEKAASIGDMAHDWAERFSIAKKLKTKTPDMPDIEKYPEAHHAITSFLEWYNDHDVVFHDAERLLFSRKYHYYGLTDTIATVDGKLYVIDYKTANAFYDEHRYQISGYRGAYEEEIKAKVDGSMVLRFSKEPKEGVPDFEATFIDNESHVKDFEVFLHLLAVKQRQAEVSVSRKYYK
jgi:hypothetical protein